MLRFKTSEPQVSKVSAQRQCMKIKSRVIKKNINRTLIQSLAIPSNYKYGSAIHKRHAVEVISSHETSLQAWVGGLTGSMVEGGGTRRKVTFTFGKDGLAWHCTGNPKNHQIFCKHCVALALSICDSSKR